MLFRSFFHNQVPFFVVGWSGRLRCFNAAFFVSQHFLLLLYVCRKDVNCAKYKHNANSVVVGS